MNIQQRVTQDENNACLSIWLVNDNTIYDSYQIHNTKTREKKLFQREFR